MDQKELQESAVMYRLLEGTLEELQKQMVLVEKKLLELEATRMSIEEVKKIEKDNDILVPIGAGVYGHGKITKHDKVLVNIGANTILEKTPASAESFVSDRKNDLLEAAGKIERDIKKVAERMNEIAMMVENASNSDEKEPEAQGG